MITGKLALIITKYLNHENLMTQARVDVVVQWFLCVGITNSQLVTPKASNS